MVSSKTPYSKRVERGLRGINFEKKSGSFLSAIIAGFGLGVVFTIYRQTIVRGISRRIHGYIPGHMLSLVV